jgi:hypothetical protein
MYKPSLKQLDKLLDMIVEAVAREIERDSQSPLMANAASSTQEKRGAQQNRVVAEICAGCTGYGA